MSDRSPYEKLGVTENASFEEVQEAKQRLTQQYKNDSQIVESIEAAYDAVIMDRLRLRQEGKIKVPEGIRFPEKKVEPPVKVVPKSDRNAPNWLQQAIDRPSWQEIAISASVFLILSIIAVFDRSEDVSLLSLLMACGLGANIYLLNRKEQRFGRSILISLVTLFLGIGVGSLLTNIFFEPNNILFLSSEQFSVLIAFALFWLVSSFIK